MKVSVVIPTIGRKSMTRALKSVLDQTYPANEILVIDDSLEQNLNYKNVKILKTGGNKGVSNARNLGLSLSSSSWVAFLDDDDYWDPNHLCKLTAFASELDADLAISSAKIVRSGLRRPDLRLALGIDPFELLYGTLHLGKSKAYLPTAGYLINQNLASKIKFDENLIDRENLDFIYQAYVAGAKIIQSQDVTLNVDYSSRESLKRANFESELTWYLKLSSINPKYARNFKFESCRNFARKLDFINALRMSLL